MGELTTDDPKTHTHVLKKNAKENARLDGNDLLYATFTPPDCRTPPNQTSCNPESLFLLSFPFSSPFVYSKKKKCWKTPWSDAPAFFSLSLYSLVFRINTGKGEKKNWVEYERKKKKKIEKSTHYTHTHGTRQLQKRRGTWLDFSNSWPYMWNQIRARPVRATPHFFFFLLEFLMLEKIYTVTTFHVQFVHAWRKERLFHVRR